MYYSLRQSVLFTFPFILSLFSQVGTISSNIARFSEKFINLIHLGSQDTQSPTIHGSEIQLQSTHSFRQQQSTSLNQSPPLENRSQPCRNSNIVQRSLFIHHSS